ncbi:MAG: hypothetical protein K0Q95_186 [Bacteroidota bacterium]|jgi:hypothetical protein|nr:hypothetical protein [Bacteroidota bacterium]
MKSRITLLIILLNVFISRAQSVMPDVVASSGDFYSNSNGQIQWTLGEVMVETYQTSGYKLTQGFHQNFALSTGINTSNLSGIMVYPNPANEFVSITLADISRSYIITLIDITGKVLHTESAGNSEATIRLNLNDVSSGIYLLKVTASNSNHHQTFRIIKTN